MSGCSHCRSLSQTCVDDLQRLAAKRSATRSRTAAGGTTADVAASRSSFTQLLKATAASDIRGNQMNIPQRNQLESEEPTLNANVIDSELLRATTFDHASPSTPANPDFSRSEVAALAEKVIQHLRMNADIDGQSDSAPRIGFSLSDSTRWPGTEVLVEQKANEIRVLVAGSDRRRAETSTLVAALGAAFTARGLKSVRVIEQ